MKRSCGVLLPVSSLPSKYGIGTFGKAAYEFVDFLRAAGQSWWQVLPLGPTGFGDSPYQSFSSNAGNPYLIDLEALISDRLLSAQEADSINWGGDAEKVDYERLGLFRMALLEKAAQRGIKRDGEAFSRFVQENEAWLPDYALFMALKKHFGMRAWTQWDDAHARQRDEAALGSYRRLLRRDVEIFEYIQLLFFRQWRALRDYARENGIGIIGDMPIYAAQDSADVWASPELFQLDENGLPTAVAGVPPDYFSESGQLWGNPLYNWDKMKVDGYAWWLRRLRGAAELYDILRIDHFRAFESYWSIPAGAESAKQGSWIKGPGLEILSLAKAELPELKLIAEDLGLLTDEVRALLRESGLPGMSVLEFAFTPGENSSYLPHNHECGRVCYTGTHDNPPLRAWLEEAPRETLDFARQYLGLNEGEGYVWGMLRAGMGSVSELFMAQLQDYLEAGAESRINIPGTLGGNWCWRLKPGQLTPGLAEKMAAMAKSFGRGAD